MVKNVLKIFTIFTFNQRRYCAFIVFCMLIGAVFEAVGIGAIMPLIAIMSDADFLDKHLLLAEYVYKINIYTYNDFIIFVAGMFFFFYIIKNTYMAWQMNLQVKFSMNNQIFYAEKLFEVYLKKSYLYHLNQNSAILLRNVNSGITGVFSGILVATFSLITELVTAVVIWIMLFLIDPITAISAVASLGIMMLFISKAFQKKIMLHGKIQNTYAAMFMKWLNQGLGAIKETKVMRKESFFLNEFARAYELFCRATNDFLFLNQLPRLFIETMVMSGLLFLIIVKVLLGNNPSEIVSLLGVLALAAFRLMPCANRIINLSNSIKFQMPFFDDIYFDLLMIRDQKKDEEKNSLFCSQKKRMVFLEKIEVKQLTFRYSNEQRDVFQDISFSINKGDFVGIIGPSGAGKTTFVDLLLGLLEPIKGTIFVDGKNIFDDIQSWQGNLAYVPQSIYLIDGTIKENIALGVPIDKIDDSKIEKVLKMAELYSFIESLTLKIDTSVGERGVKLSGGQRQRIGIARALYCEPDVLILDEATSALDGPTEASITNTIRKLKGEVTIISIAHRISTLEGCDFKVKFNDSKVEIIR